MLGEIKKKTQGVPSSCFVGVAWNFFFSKRCQFLLNTLSLSAPVIFFPLNAPKGPDKAPVVNLLRLNTLRGTKTWFS